MAEPEPFDVPHVHPCEPGHAFPKGAFHSWVAEEVAYLVACARCGQGARGPNPASAVEEWNSVHPARELTDEEQAGLSAAQDLDTALQGVPRAYLCDEGVHIINKLPEGTYACAQCGLSFREHHSLEIVAGVGAFPEPR